MWERSGAASKENCEAQFFRNSCRTRTMFHGQNGHNHESWTNQKGYSDKYVIVYTNGRTVQEQERLLSTIKVGMLTRVKVQGAFSTYRMLYLIEETITKPKFRVCLSSVCYWNINLIHVGNCWKMWGLAPHCQVILISVLSKLRRSKRLRDGWVMMIQSCSLRSGKFGPNKTGLVLSPWFLVSS